MKRLSPDVAVYVALALFGIGAMALLTGCGSQPPPIPMQQRDEAACAAYRPDPAQFWQCMSYRTTNRANADAAAAAANADAANRSAIGLGYSGLGMQMMQPRPFPPLPQ